VSGRDRLLALVVVVTWGFNFPATAYALQHFPPLMLASLRYVLIAIPALLLVPRPQVPARWILAAGTGFGVTQFGALYLAMHAGMPPGLASVVLQCSAPFTVVLAAFLFHERLSARRIAGISVAVIGLSVIGWSRAEVGALVPVLLTILGGFGWACGNIVTRAARPPIPFHFMVWISVVPPIPLGIVSLAVEGWEADREALMSVFAAAALPSLGGLLYIVLAATLLGYGLWMGLLTRHPASQVAPWSMLVPVVGMLSSWAAFGERPGGASLVGALLVIAGIALATIGRAAAAGRPAEVKGA
jgi:O-acetylserine/cysteine efflux transporter